MMRARAIFAAFVLALAFATPVAAGPLEDGLAAYERQDYAEAAKRFRLAAEKGDALAQKNLGFLYESGFGVPQSYAEAMKWYLLAADQGYTFAQTALGMMYDFGHGVPRDYVRAHMWYNLASALGHKDGATWRDAVATLMTPAQIAGAQKLAVEWKPTKK